MEKVCSQCGISKDVEQDFYWRLKAANRRREECKECSSKRNKTPEARKAQHKCQAKWRAKPENKARLKENHRRWRRSNPDRVWENMLQTRFGLRIADYYRMLDEQRGVCDICKNPRQEGKKRFSVDHDHACCPGEMSCGKCVRGLLCQCCNALLGQARDKVETLRSAITYLIRHERNAEIIARAEGCTGVSLGQIPREDQTGIRV